MQDDFADSESEVSSDHPMLDQEELRVLGSLVEKRMTTPDYYPMTLNGLKNACNQKSSRYPVVAYNDQVVERALDGLRDKRLVVKKITADGRVPKFAHAMDDVFGLACEELAILCILMLRGPQTLGEIRSRSTRMYAFSGLDEVEVTLNKLLGKTPRPLVKILPRQLGHKEQRFQHLLGNESTVVVEDSPLSVSVSQASADAGLEQRIRRLEQRVEQLARELEALQSRFS